MTRSLWYQLLLVAAITIGANTFAVEPGVVVERKGILIVLFEVSEFGAGGLVFNQPSPIRLADLAIPRFGAFRGNSLMFGRDLSSSGETSVAVGDMAPWFWLHNIEALAKSSRLAGSEDPLFIGGNIDEASDLVLSGKVDPERFKFFHKYTSWEGMKLEKELFDGTLQYRGQATASEVLKPYSLII